MRVRITGISALAGGMLLLPALAFAQQVPVGQGLFNIIGLATRFLNAMVALFVLVAVVVFFWGIIRYLSGGAETKAEGLKIAIWGIIAIFVMVSIWGLIRILQQTVGVDSNMQALTPQGIQPRF